MANFFDDDTTATAPASAQKPNFFDETPAPPPSSGLTIGNALNWLIGKNDPQTVLQPRSLSQAGTDVANFGRVAANTLGQGDQLLASTKALQADISGAAKNPGAADLVKQQITGQPSSANDLLTNLAAERAKTTQASQDIGPAGTLAANIVGSAPVAGATGATTAAKLAPYTGRWLGGVLGSAAENAGVAGVSAAARGDPVGQAMAIGGLGGAAAGAPGGVSGTGVLPATKTASEYAQDATGAYNHAGTINFSNAQVQQAISNARRSISQQPARVIQDGQGASKLLDTMADESLQYGGMSAERLNDFNKRFHSSLTGDANPGAGQTAQSQIQSVLSNANPVSGHAPGEAQSVLNMANTAYGKSEDLTRLENWQTKAGIGGGLGPDVASQARSWLGGAEGQRVAPPGSPQNQAIDALAATGSKGGGIPWAVKHYVVAPAIGGLAGEGMAYATGDENNPWARAAGDIGMMTGSMVGSKAYQGASGVAASAAQKRAIDATRATIGTGRLYSPVTAPTPIADSIRRLYSYLTPGALPGTSSH